MVCTECREGDHDHCYDTKHPEQGYRGCACQHRPRRPAEENPRTNATPVKAAVGATSQFARYHVDNGDGFALCRPDYALNPRTAYVFRDWVPVSDHRCQRNGCARAWNQLMGELGFRVLPHGNTKPLRGRT